MRKKIVIESHIKNWEFLLSSKNEYAVIGEDISFKDVARDLECSPKLLQTIKESLDYLRECLVDDLADLYRMIDGK